MHTRSVDVCSTASWWACVISHIAHQLKHILHQVWHLPFKDIYNHQELSNHSEIISHIDSCTWLTMSFTQTVLEHSNSNQSKKGDEIMIKYVSFLYNEIMNGRGWWWVPVSHSQRQKLPTLHVSNSFNLFESQDVSFITAIRVSKVIQGLTDCWRHKCSLRALMLTYHEGWDEGIMKMRLGEKSILKIFR